MRSEARCSTTSRRWRTRGSRPRCSIRCRRSCCCCCAPRWPGPTTWSRSGSGAERNLAFLRRFLPYGHGIPSHDTLGEVIAALDPELFKGCFAAWVEGLRDEPEARPHRHRRQDLAPHPRPEQGPRAAAPGLRLGQPPAAGARAGGGGRQVERDHRHPAPAGAAGAERRPGHDRRHRHAIGQSPRPSSNAAATTSWR